MILRIVLCAPCRVLRAQMCDAEHKRRPQNDYDEYSERRTQNAAQN